MRTHHRTARRPLGNTHHLGQQLSVGEVGGHVVGFGTQRRLVPALRLGQAAELEERLTQHVVEALRRTESKGGD